MKTNSLTQIELATIAAAIPGGSPAERVDTALRIWVAAGKRLEAMASRADQLATPRAADLEQARLLEGIEFPAGTVPLNVFLAKTAPKLSREERLEKFLEFLAVPNPAVPGGTSELNRIKTEGIGPAYVKSFAAVFRRFLERQTSGTISISRRAKSEAALLARYGEKWVREALGDADLQMQETLVSNTAKEMGGDRTKAQGRVQSLIDSGRLVKLSGKLYGIPGGKSKRTKK